MTPRASSRRSRVCTAETERPTAADSSASVARALRETSRTIPSSMSSSRRAGTVFAHDPRLSAGPRGDRKSSCATDVSTGNYPVDSEPRSSSTRRSEVHMSIHARTTQVIVGEPEVVEDALRRAQRPRSRRAGVAAAQGGRDRAPGPAGQGRLDSGCRIPRRRARPRRPHHRGDPRPRPRVPARRRVPRRIGARLRALGGRGLRRPGLPRLARRPSSRSSTGSTASVTSSCSRCTRRTARRTGTSRRCSSR